MSSPAPLVREARAVAELRLWMMEQWRPGHVYHRSAAFLDARGWIEGERRHPGRYAEWELKTLETATLWWVGADMVDLLLAAAAGIPDEVVQYDLPLPAGAGLVVFEKPWWGLDADAQYNGGGEDGAGRVAIDGILWGTTRWEPRVVAAPHPDSFAPGVPGTPWYTGVSFSSYRRVDFGAGLDPQDLRMATAVGAYNLAKPLAPPAAAPPEAGLSAGSTTTVVGGEVWMPLGRSDWPLLHHITDQPWSTPVPPAVLASYVEDRKIMAAFWTLIAQEGITRRTEERPDRAAVRRAARAGVSAELSPVQVITLRRARRTEAEPADGHAKVDWSHRWLVSGHWRWQPVGPGRTQRRLTYVRPHVKGPDDKPLHVPTRVNAWTR